MVSQQQASAPRPTIPSSNPTNIFAEGIAETFRNMNAPTDAPEPSDDPEYEAPETDEDEPETELPAEEEQETEEPEQSADEPQAQQKQPKRSVEEWADIVASDGWGRLSEISPRQHQQVAELAAQKMVAQARTNERDAISNQLTQERNLARFIGDVDAHYANDPDGKLAWWQSGDPNARVYIDGRNYLTSISNQTPQEHVNVVSAMQQRSARQFSRLNGFSDLQSEIASRQQQGRYPATDDGLAQLETDVDQLLVEVARGNGRRQPNAGTTPVRSARRPVMTGPSRTGTVRTEATPDISKIKDPDQLFAMGVEAQMRQRSR